MLPFVIMGFVMKPLNLKGKFWLLIPHLITHMLTEQMLILFLTGFAPAKSTIAATSPDSDNKGPNFTLKNKTMYIVKFSCI